MGRSNVKTHTNEKVQESFGEKYYSVRKRTNQESNRLRTLRDQLNPEQHWTVTRKIHGGVEVRIHVDAINAREAKDQANEVQYALNWMNGAYKNDKGKKEPEDWALKYEDYEMVVRR